MNTENRGFSLVEVIVAMTILVTGVLALAASSAAVTRMTASGALQAEASLVVSSRFERLRALGCSQLAGGTATTGSYAETWSVTSTGDMRTVSLIVSYNTGRRTRSDTLTMNMSCAPQAG